MTAGANSNSVGYLSTEIGSLTAPATFSLDGTQYGITGISIMNVSGRLSLRMADQAVTSHLQALFLDNGYDLYIDQRQFAIDDSTRDSDNSEFRWTTVSQLWQAGDSIDIRIGKDIYPPTIVNGPQLVSVPPSDGYTFQSPIDIQFTFSEPVTVTGDLRLPIVIDGQNRTRARYRSGSGTSTLLFRYTVSTYEVDPNGIEIVADILNGSRVVDAAGNSAAADHSEFPAPNIHTIHNDVTPPVLQRIWANLSSLRLVYDEPLSQRNLLVENFTATAGERIISIDSIRAVENTMRLTLAEPIQAGESVTLTYRPYLGRLTIRDSHGNSSARFSDRIVENVTGQDLPEVTISYTSTDQCVHNGSSLCSVEGEEISFLLSRSPVAGIEPQAQIVEVDMTDDRASRIYTLYASFSEGQSSVETVFRLPDNASKDLPYELTAAVSAAAGYDIGTPGSVQLTVKDDADQNILISLLGFEAAVPEGRSFTNHVTIAGECLDSPNSIQTIEQFQEYWNNYPHPPPDPVKFSVVTKRDTAQPWIDYEPFSIIVDVPTSQYGSLPARCGSGFQWQARVPVVVTTYDDDLPEPTEYFSWQLGAAPGQPSNVVTNPRESSVAIFDYDYRFNVEISPAEGVEIQEGNGSTSVEVVATLATGSLIGFDVALVSLPGTATLADGDYLLNGSANADARVQFAKSDFQPEQTPGGVERYVARKHVRVEALDDDEVESSESFELVLAKVQDSLTTNIVLAETRVPVTIIDAAPDPAVPEVFIQAGVESIEEGGTAVWRIYRKGDTSGELEVFVSAPTANLSNGILIAVPSSVTIPAAETSGLLEIVTVDDDDVNESRTVTISLGSGSEYEVEEDRSTAGVDVTDNDLPDIYVSFGASSVTVVEGSTVEVSVQLDRPPGASRELTIPITAVFRGSATSSDFTGVPSSVEFAGMQTEATFDVAVVADAETEEGELMSLAFGSLPVGVESENPKVQNIYSEDVTFSFDEANHTVAEGDDIYIQIMLSHALSSEIEIPLEVRRVAGTADPISRISGVPQSVIFEPGATSLEFSVSVADDQVASGTDSVVVVEPTGWTRRVSVGIPDRVTLSISDDDEAAVEISPQSLVLTEGATEAYTVVLGSEPTGAVTIVPAVVGNSDVSLNVANLNFDAANWNVPQRVTVSAAEDFDAADDSATITHTVSGADYAGVPGPTVAVSVSDNETASTAVRIGVDTSTVDEEGGSRDVTVTATLNGAPLSNDVVLTVSVEDDSAEESTDFEAVTEFDVTIEGGSSAGSQVFTLTPISDHRDEGDETLLLSATTSASLAVDPSPGLVLKIIDDDTAGVTITPVELSFAEGASDTYSVVLDSEPSDTVRIEMSRSGSSDVTVSPSQLTFTTSDWATARTVTVNSEQDDDMADDSATIKHTVQGGDYEGRTARGVQITVVDDDVAGLVLDKTSVSVDEGAEETFTVALATQPTATVTVDVTSTDVAEATVSPPSLEFTTANWATAKTVTVTGAQDPDSADETVTVTLDTNSVDDTEYGALVDVAVAVTVTDDDDAGLKVVGAPVDVDEGAEETFTVALATQPTATVTVDVTSTDVAEATVSPPSLEFTTANWATAKTVTVTGAQDPDSADETVTVTLDTNSVDDTEYGALVDVAVAVTVTDDDDAGLKVVGAPVDVDEGAEETFTVALATQPTATVTVDVTSTDVAEATVSPPSLEFTTANWATAKTVTVTGAQDPDSADETVTVTLDTNSVDDTEYGALVDVAVAVTVTDDDDAGLKVVGAPVDVDEGAEETFTVALATQPTATVTVDVTSTDVAEATVSPPSLEFTTANWATAKTVTVTGAQDPDSADETVTVTLDTNSVDDTEYGALVDVAVAVTVTDDDDAGLKVVGAPVDVDEGAEETFTVALATQPTATVTVDVTSTDVAEATVSPPSLEFTTANWATAKTVTVTGAQDPDSADETVTVTLDTNSVDDTEYGALVDVAVAVTVTDDDDAGLKVVGAPVDVDEGAEETFTVALATQPTATVTVDVTSTDVAEATVSPPSLEFTTANWATAKTVTVTGAQDPDSADETVTVTLDTNSVDDTEYGALVDVAVAVTVTDDDDAGLKVVGAPVDVDEGAEETFTVALATQPTATVTVDVTSTDVAEATVSPPSLEFTTANWATAKTVTVTGAQDPDSADETVTVTLDTNSVDDTEYGALVDVAVAVTVTDDDDAGLKVVGAPVDVDEGAEETFTVALATQPTATVTVDVTSTDVAEATVSPPSLEFTTANWATAKTVTVTGAQDPDSADETVTVTLDTNSVDDTEYGALVDVAVAVTVTDDDDAGLKVVGAPVDVDEGAEETFTVALATQPTATVTVDVTSTDVAEATVSPPSLEFTTANWATAKTVTVTGAQDPDSADETVTVTLDTNSVDDTEYGALVDVAVAVTVTDDDDAGLKVVGAPVDVDEGAEETFTVALATQPTATVTVDVTSTDVAEATVSPPSLEFTTANWATAKTVTVTGAQDPDSADETVTVTLDTNSVDDTEYGALVDVAVAVTVTDDDDAGLKVVGAPVDVDEGAEETFTVALATQPTATVTVDVTSTDVAEATVSPPSLEFTTANWATAKTVTVTGAQDPDSADETVTVTLDTNSVDDTEYGALVDVAVAVTVTDDDDAGLKVVGAPVDVDEGAEETFTVALATQPTATVTVDVTSTDVAEATVSPPSLEFTTANWATAKTVTVTGAQDPDSADETVTVTLDTNSVDDTEYGALVDVAVAVTVTDDDDAGLKVVGAPVDVDEGAEETFTVALATQPTATVTVDVTSTDVAEATVSPPSLEFTTANWATAKTVTVTGAQDPDSADETVTVTLDTNSVDDTEYGALVDVAVAVTVTDDDDAGLKVVGAPVDVDEGAEETFTVALATQPTATVTVDVTSTDVAEATVSPPSLEFTTANWATAKTVTVTGAQDPDSADETVTVTLDTNSVDDTEYGALVDVAVAVTVTDDDDAGLKVVGAPVDVDEGAEETFTVALATQPTATVTVDVTSTDVAEATVSPPSLEFTTANWATAKTVTVTGAQDPDSADETVTVTLDTNSVDDTEYGALVDVAVAVTVTDDDDAGLKVVGAPVDVDEGAEETFTVALATQPTATVTVDVTSTDVAEATVSPPSLEFTTANWATAKTVTVTGAQDPDSADETVTVTLDTNSVDDTEYGALVDVAVAVTVTDDDDAGLKVVGAPVDVDEGAEETFTVALATQPTATVTVDVTSTDVAEATVSPPSLEFTTANWATAKTVTVTGAQDPDSADETVTVTLDTNSVDDTEYGALVDVAVAVTVTDDDDAGLKVVGAPVDVDEGAEETFTVALATQPTATVTVDVTSTDVAEATVSPPSLEFTTANWATAKTVTVTGAQDPDSADETVTVTLDTNSVDDTEYGALVDVAVAVTVTDDDDAGLKVVGAPVDVDEGAEETFTVALATQPTATVTVDVTSTDVAEATVSPPSLEFTTANWATAKTVTVTGAQDPDSADETVTVTLDTNSVDDTEYGALVDVAVAVTVTDDDDAGLKVVGAPVDVDEGAEETFTVALATQPTATVTVDVTSTDVAEATVSPPSLEFTTANWATAKTVTVTGAQDPDSADETVTVTLDTNSVDDTEYGALVDVAVAVTVTDDDDAGLKVVGAPVDVDEGAEETFTVALATQPTATVTVDVTSTDVAEATVSPPSLEFTTANWATAKTVTVTGAQDPDSADETVTVTLDTNSVDDTEYGALVDVAVAVTVTDDDDAGLKVVGAPVDVDEGAEETFTVALATQPTATVTVDVTSTDVAEATVSPPSLEFTTANWATAKTVTVTGAQDPDSADETVTVTLDTNSVDDTEYGALVDVAVAVTVTDDDDAGLKVVGAPVDVDEGAEETFTVALATQPTATVTVDVTSTDVAEATVSPPSLEFTTANWATAKTVTVTGAQDPDSADETVTVTLDTNSVDDTEYGALVDVAVAVTVTDDDDAGLKVVGAPVDVDEGAEETFTVALATQPTATVTVDVTSTDVAEATVSPPSLEFTTANWATAKTVTVTGAQDPDSADETVTVTLDTNSVDDTEYGALVDVAVAVTVTDDDDAGLKVVGAPVDVDEGAEETFTVALATQPTATVTVDVTSTDVAEATVSPPSLEFTTANWATAKTVTVTGAQDPDSADETVTVTLDTNSVDDTEYGALVDVAVAVTVTDDDDAGLKVVGAPVDVDEGAEETFTVALATQPTATVTVDVTSTDVAEATVSPPSLEFTTANWATAKTVTVTGAQDPDSADETVTVTLDTNSVDDTEYGALVDVAVAVTVTDDDDAGLKVVGAPVDVDEGAEETFTVALATQPTATVTVDVTSTDVAEATVSPPSLEFTTANWATAKTVTVTGAQDPDSADETVTVTLDTNSVDDAGYAALVDVTVAVTVTDDDDDDDAGLPILSGITVWGEERLESEVWAIFLVKLGTAMSAEMTLEYATADGTARAGEDYVATSGTLTIPAGVTSISVLVDLVEDAIAEDDETVVLRVNVPSDETQQAISGTALIIDDDNVGVLDIGDAKFRETDEYLRFELTLSRPTTNDVAVDYETADGTATAGQDYVATSGTLTIPAGELAASIKVALLDDSIDEIHERFTVELRNAKNADMGDSSGTGTIADGDPLPVMVVGVVEAAESEPEVELTVTLTSISSRLITADYITFDHTAVGDGVDYVTTAGSLRFEPGEIHKTISIRIVDDDLNEGDETFTVILEDIKNARRGDRSHSVTILDDDGHSVSNAG